MNILSIVLDFLFPPVCGICGKFDKDYLCEECFENLERHMVAVKVTKMAPEDFYNEMLYIFKYEGIIRNKIIEYKFKDKAYLSKMFCKIFVKSKNCCDFLKSYDIIIPVPIHRKRKIQRGYNQCELIARQLADYVESMICTDVLVKQRNTVPQSTLGKEERKNNIKNVYIIQNKDKIKNKSILILDDIYTTGSTVNECSRILKKAGATKIGVLTIAKD